MIDQILKPENILINPQGGPEAVLRRLASSLSCREMLSDIEGLLKDPNAAMTTSNPKILIPHIRLAGLTHPKASLAISRRGISSAAETFHLIFLLVSPEADAAGHLKMLQRLAALLPQLSKRLLGSRNPVEAMSVLIEGEQKSARPTYLNLTQEQVAFELRTDLVSGLSGLEAGRRLEFHGPNVIEKLTRVPVYLKFLRSFFSFFAILLWLAGMLCYIPGVDMPQLGAAILIVVLVNGFFSFLQEYRSDKAVEALARLLGQRCRVIRDDRVTEIDAALLVPGDLLLLEEGDIVAADARLIEANEVEVDISSLTGESTSAKRYKSDRPVLLPGKFLWIELPNVVFTGSVVVRGTARALVFGTGMNTEIGTIAGMTQAIPTEDSPLQQQLQGTVYAIAALAGGIGLGILFMGWLLAGLSFIQAFVFFIGIFVANVPEGLLPTVTLSLAMGVKRMARRNAVVKHLSSVETLGCTTVICSDKTGTLTQNLIMVKWFWADGKIWEATGQGYCPIGRFRLDGEFVDPAQITASPAAAKLLECAFVCNNAHLEKKQGRWVSIGDPTEGALMALARKAGIRGIHQRIHVNPFESVRKRMSVLVRLEAQNEKLLYVKGALVETVDLCDRILRNGCVRGITDEDRQEIRNESDALAAQGLRILAFAYRDHNSIKNMADFTVESAERELIFIGFTAMSDPVRQGVPEAVTACHTAGIRILMITGDYPLTARCIAREIGLGQGEGRSNPVYQGTDLMEMDDEELKTILKTGEPVFARVAPDQKLRIVSLLKEMGEIVAVTGDGVNDGPALRRADIGIAMGQRGTDVAREAAHMVLADDNFPTIVAAIEEGRAIFENIKRFAAYVLNSNPQELYPYILWMLFPHLPLAMTVMGVLAVDVGTDLIPAMGLGIERPEKGIMEVPPRKKEEKLLSIKFILRSYFIQGSILALACYATYFFAGWIMGWVESGNFFSGMPASPSGLNMREASTAYLMSLTAYFFPTIATQIANVQCKRSWKISIFSKAFIDSRDRGRMLDAIRNSRPWAAPFSRFLERHPIVFNFISNPLIDLGIAFEIGLCVLFFYTGLSGIYYFAPVPWPIYLFAFHGAVVLFAFEETKKYFRRRGYPLEFLG